LALTAITYVTANSLAAGADAAKCKDPAMFPKRVPNYAIASCKTSNDSETFRWPGGSEQPLGLRTEVVYRVGDIEKGASPKYIVANYANAIKSIGGTLLLDPAKTTLGDRLTARVDVEGRDVWVHVTSDGAVVKGNWQTYKVITLAGDQAAQVVTAQKLLDELNRDGFVTLYVNFDTAKWDIKPESQSTIDDVAAMLNANPAIKVSVEGHTDNVGQPAANKTLSANRARSVMEALVKGGVEAGRLESNGHGQDKPIADNRTEEGRAKNRRVELVKR
jgi:outer membrane protein OmpA-like peptidoglycan-associated protein